MAQAGAGVTRQVGAVAVAARPGASLPGDSRDLVEEACRRIPGAGAGLTRYVVLQSQEARRRRTGTSEEARC